MFIFIKRLFVYFLIVNYLQLTISPSYVMAVGIEPLPLIERISPAVSGHSLEWERPKNLDPAEDAVSLPTMRISLHRQTESAYNFQVIKDSAILENRLLTISSVGSVFDGHGIRIDTTDFINGGLKVGGMDNVCNYIFEIDGMLKLDEDVATSGYFRVNRAEGFSYPSILRADSGVFLQEVKAFVGEGEERPLVVSRKGPVQIKGSYGDRKLEIKANLEARKGIEIEVESGELVLASILKTPSEIFLKSQRDILFKKAGLLGLAGIEINSLGGLLKVDSSQELSTFFTHKVLGMKGKKVDLQKGSYIGLEGIRLAATGGHLRVGACDGTPELKTNGGIVLGATEESQFLKCNLQAGGDITSNAPRTVLGPGDLRAELTANEKITLTSPNLLINNALVTGINGITANGSQGNLTLGSETYEPILQSKGIIRLLGEEKTHIVSGSYQSDTDIKVDSNDLAIGVAQSGMYLRDHWQQMWEAYRTLFLADETLPSHLKSKEAFDKDYIETKLLPELRKLTSTSGYETYEVFSTTPGTGYRVGMDMEAYWQLWEKDTRFGPVIKERGMSLPRYELPVYLMNKTQFDRHYIETKLLPELRKLTSTSGYETYEIFSSTPGTGYKVGMDMEAYWQLWEKDTRFGPVIKERGITLPRYELPVYLMSKAQFDRHYIETKLLTVIYKMVPNPVYENYENFVKTPATKYTAGMDLNDYWQLWVKDSRFGPVIKQRGLTVPAYELPVTLMSKEQFDRYYIETQLLPEIRKIENHPAYRTYETFITTPITGYGVGMDLNQYWQSKWALSREGRTWVARIVLFLRSGLPYRYPRVTGFAQVPVLLLSLVTLGWFGRFLRRRLWRGGDESIWPFYSRSEYETALQHPVFLNGAAQPGGQPDQPPAGRLS